MVKIVLLLISLLRPNIHFSIILQMKQILESHVRCLVFTLWVDRLGIVQQVCVKFYICDRAARKMYNVKLVCFMYLLISLMLHVKQHKNCLNLCECLVHNQGIWSQQLYGLRMHLGLHNVYYISEDTPQICADGLTCIPSSVWKTNFYSLFDLPMLPVSRLNIVLIHEWINDDWQEATDVLREKTGLNATLSTTYPTWNALRSNSCPHAWRQTAWAIAHSVVLFPYKSYYSL